MYDPGLDPGSKKESTNRETKSSHKEHYGDNHRYLHTDQTLENSMYEC